MTPNVSLDAYQKKIKRVLITEEEIKEAIKKAGKMIDDLYDGRPILLVSILKGAFVFLSLTLQNIVDSELVSVNKCSSCLSLYKCSESGSAAHDAEGVVLEILLEDIRAGYLYDSIAEAYRY